jgi:hypothetical protein
MWKHSTARNWIDKLLCLSRTLLCYTVRNAFSCLPCVSSAQWHHTYQYMKTKSVCECRLHPLSWHVKEHPHIIQIHSMWPQQVIPCTMHVILLVFHYMYVHQDSSFSKVTSCELNDRFYTKQRRIFLFATTFRPAQVYPVS